MSRTARCALWYNAVMSTKTAKAPTKSGFRYVPEDLAPRDASADETVADGYANRNKKALNASIDKAHAEFERGKYFTRDQVAADIKASRQRRRAGKK